MDSHLIMKTLSSTFVKLKPYFQAVSAIFLSLSLLSACQKTPEPDTANETAPEATTQTTPVTSNINAPTNTDDINTSTSAANPEQDVSLTELEDSLSTTDNSINDPAPAPNPEQAIKGAQITDV